MLSFKQKVREVCLFSFLNQIVFVGVKKVDLVLPFASPHFPTQGKAKEQTEELLLVFKNSKRGFCNWEGKWPRQTGPSWYCPYRRINTLSPLSLFTSTRLK